MAGGLHSDVVGADAGDASANPATMLAVEVGDPGSSFQWLDGGMISLIERLLLLLLVLDGERAMNLIDPTEEASAAAASC
jgi:hypothetical protein